MSALRPTRYTVILHVVFNNRLAYHISYSVNHASTYYFGRLVADMLGLCPIMHFE